MLKTLKCKELFALFWYESSLHSFPFFPLVLSFRTSPLPLPLSPSPISYDLCRGFIPSPGHLKHLATPTTTPTVRVDTGVRQGDHVTTFYDPMIAKLVVWDQDRTAALKKLHSNLSQYQVGD